MQKRADFEGLAVWPFRPTTKKEHAVTVSARKRGLKIGLAASTAIFLPLAAAAQTAGDGRIPEIVVSARKQSENLQDVPISITAFDAEQIDLHNFRTLQDIAYSVPNLNISRLTTLSTQISIRGINSADSSPGFETGVAVILDDVYVGRAAGFSTSLLDIERIEVLRGPQGTIQGRNVIGGSINVVTARPSDEFFAKGKVSYGNYDQFVATGVVGGPIVEGKLAGKFGVGRYYHDGFGENVSLGKPLDTEDAWSYRAQLSFTPTDDLEILLTGDYDTFDMHDFHNDFGPAGIAAPTPDLLDREVEGDVWNTGEREVWGAAVNIYYDLSETLSLASITSYRGYDVAIVQEGDPWQNFGLAGAGTFVATAANDQSQHQISQEIRLSSDGEALSWLAGLYYYAETLENYQNFLFGPSTGTEILGGSTIDDSEVTTDSYAAFASATYRFNDLLSATGGLRYTINERDAVVTETYGVDGVDPILGTYVDMLTLDDPAPKIFDAPILLGTTTNSISDKVLTGDFTLTADWTPDVSTYVKYARGFKGGGFNTSFNEGFSGGAVKPEYLDAGEIGLRSVLFDRALRFNATAFYMKHKDQQVLQFDPTTFRYVTANEPGTRTMGVEIDGALALTDNLTWSFGGAYTDAEVTAGPNEGAKMAYTSPWSFTNSVAFDAPITEDVSFFLFHEASWRDGYTLAPGATGVAVQPSYWWLSGRIGVKSADGRWTLGAYGRNLLDKTVVSSASDIPGLFSVAFVQQPRTYGVELSVDF